MRTQQNAGETTPKGIVINRMYVGDYLSENLGHEVVNLFKADNDKHYIYLNATGNFAKEHHNKIGYMLFVKYYDKGLVEVIGMATGLEEVPGADMQLNRKQKFNAVDEKIWKLQKNYIEKTEEGIFYDGVSILEIFNDAEQQSVFLTYKADKVFRIKSSVRRFIRFSNVEENSDANLPTNEIVQLAEHKQAKASLKQYIYPSDSCDYEKLFILFNDSSLWEDKVVDRVDTKKLSVKPPRKVSIFDICRIHDDENRFSNALAYFMEQLEYKELWDDFFKNVNCFNLKTGRKEKLNINIDFNSAYKVTREESAKIEDDEWKKNNNATGGGRIDIVVRDENNIVVIENKIKSDVNTVPHDKGKRNQLNRYVEYIDWSIKTDKEHGTTPYFIILTPNYNIPEISKEMKQYYKIITYRDLYTFLDGRDEVNNDPNFRAFFEAMYRHTHENVNDYLYYEMLEKFERRIKEVKSKNNPRD